MEAGASNALNLVEATGNGADALKPSPALEVVLSSAIPARRYSQSVFCHLLILAEMLIYAAAITEALRFLNLPSIHLATALLGGLLGAAAILFATGIFGGTEFDGFIDRKPLLASALAGAVVAGAAAGFSKATANEVAVVAGAIFALVIFCRTTSFAICALALRRGLLVRSIAVVGGSAVDRSAVSRILQSRNDIAIVFSGAPEDADSLQQLCADGLLDEIVLAGGIADSEAVERLANLPAYLVRVAPRDQMVHSSNPEHTRWGTPVTVLCRPPLRDWGMIAKRMIDIYGALAAIMIFSPVLLLAALAVRLESKGPVFFRQDRFGYRSKPFSIIKFRTMYTQMSDLTGSVLTSRNDPRVTRVGEFLRKTSIDELPQLFNVLRGEMSLVGPRPHPSGARAGGVLYDDLIPDFRARYAMIPGITGLAQVSGFRGNTETQAHLIARFDKDMEYARVWSPLLDIAILFRTVAHVIHGENAY